MNDATDLKPVIGRLAAGKVLDHDEARTAFEIIMSGRATPVQIASFLTALRQRGETVGEIAGAVAIMRDKMTRVEAPEGAMDIVGTGGDASGSYNISTTAALIVAGTGIPVAKHGNRALSSRSGAADTLRVLGVNLDLPPEGIARCIREAGIGFMFAPAHHSAMKHVGPVRAELGFRTVFNLIGPLSNPAGVTRYMLGVFSPDWVVPLAEVLAASGAERAWVVHGAGGLDEISPSGETQVASLEGGKITSMTVTPADAGLDPHPLESIRGGEAEENAAALRDILGGAKNAYRDTSVLNAAAALVVAGRAVDLADGARQAAESLDSGAARKALDDLVRVSNG